MLTTLNWLTEHQTGRTQHGAGSAMNAGGVTGPDFMPRPFAIGEPIAAPDGVVDVMTTSVNDYHRAAVRGRHLGRTNQH
jgi:hypothetical protein